MLRFTIYSGSAIVGAAEVKTMPFIKIQDRLETTWPVFATVILITIINIHQSQNKISKNV